MLKYSYMSSNMLRYRHELRFDHLWLPKSSPMKNQHSYYSPTYNSKFWLIFWSWNLLVYCELASFNNDFGVETKREHGLHPSQREGTLAKWQIHIVESYHFDMHETSGIPLTLEYILTGYTLCTFVVLLHFLLCEVWHQKMFK